MALKICVGVSGSIAAYRSPDFVKELVARGHEVRVLLSDAAKELVSARVLETFSGSPTLAANPFDATHFGTDHIAVARWADIFVVYGATANFMAKYSAGLTDDFLSLQLIATRSPVVVAPAMNPAMWEHASVQDNFSTLKKRGTIFVEPIHGKVACGETGVGHIAEIVAIADAVEIACTPGHDNLGVQCTPGHESWLSGKTVLISAGPMRSGMDPVRYIQNRSSGKMGLALALAAQKLGAHVKVLLGPVDASIAKSFGAFDTVRYENPTHYEEKLAALSQNADVFLSAAAVLDFEAIPAKTKIDRSKLKGGELLVKYRPVPDFVAKTAQSKRRPARVIAFAAETGTNAEIVARATRKMKEKGVDAIIANPVRLGLGPDADENEVWIIKGGKKPLHLGPKLKSELAEPILRALFDS